jgi:tetratricopeptide (TPR) repeat protein
MRSKYLLLIITIIIFMLAFSSCKNKEAEEENKIQEASEETVSTDGTEEVMDEGAEEQDNTSEASAGEEESGAVEAAGSWEEDSGQSEDTSGQEDQEEIKIPEEITSAIEEADSLFAQGLYAEAAKEYRNAQIAVDGTQLPEETKRELLDLITENLDTSKDITDMARMHHSNAMNLMYEKRYEEAEAELNAALEIYPKYQDALDALESLEDIKGVQ